MNLKIVSEPAIEPVSLSDAKLFLRLDSTTEDAFVSSLIKAARRFCEKYTGRAFISQEWEGWLDQFPSKAKDSWWDGTREGHVSSLFQTVGHLEIGLVPLQELVSITTFDESDAETVFSNDSVTVDTNSNPGRIVLKSGQCWPTDLRPVAAVKVQFIAGYGDTAEAVPQEIIQSMLMLIGHWYENRTAVLTGTISTDLGFTVNALLAPYVRHNL